jgi:DNA mismatch endonuclease (patch repair protein)
MAKIARTRARDAETTAFLKAAGWTVIRIWEHEAPDVAASMIADAVKRSS